MAVAFREHMPEAVPGIPDADDLPDTVVAPPGAYAILPDAPGPFEAALLEELRATVRVLDQTCARIAPWLEGHTATLTTLLTQHATTLSTAEASALQHLCEASEAVCQVLETVQREGLTVRGDPCVAELHALTPGGYPVTLRFTRSDGAALLEAVVATDAWLTQHAYTTPPAALAL